MKKREPEDKQLCIAAHTIKCSELPLDEQIYPSMHTALHNNNHIVIGSFKEFFHHVNMNNLAEVLKALRELNFILDNRAPRQITAEEVPNLVRAHLNWNTAYNPEYSARGRPHSRGNQHHWYS